MKYIGIEQILEKYPNKYIAIIIASKEARKIIEAQKPPALPRETEDTQSVTAGGTAVRAPEAVEITAESNVPKRRGRKPKKLAETKEEIEGSLVKTETPKELSSSEDGVIQRGQSVVAEKAEQNPYLAALKKILE